MLLSEAGPSEVSARFGLARAVLIALAGGVIGRWIAGFVLGVVEPILLGLGLVDPVPQSWAGTFPVLGSGLLPDYLLGACGGAALTLHAFLSGWLSRRRVRHALAVLATLAGAGSIQVLLRSTDHSSIAWTSVLGLGFASAILAGAAASPLPPMGPDAKRRLWTLVAIATLCLGVPTLAEAWSRHSPKDYPASTIEFAVLRDFGRDLPLDPVVARMEVDSSDLLLVREPAEGLIELHLSWSKTGQLLDLTRDNVGNELSVRVDGVEVSCPTIRSVITRGQLVITQGTSLEARELLRRLSGAQR